mmetsp:Transcript_7427/g.18208  ORF Transcript_7427/g.18208 Transcript_7427/m.18208 type:complete len:241 (+) Transcript_7427:919-1641(+)
MQENQEQEPRKQLEGPVLEPPVRSATALAARGVHDLLRKAQRVRREDQQAHGAAENQPQGQRRSVPLLAQPRQQQTHKPRTVVQPRSQQRRVHAAQQGVQQHRGGDPPKDREGNDQKRVDDVGSDLDDGVRRRGGRWVLRTSRLAVRWGADRSQRHAHQLYEEADEPRPGGGKGHHREGIGDQLQPQGIAVHLDRNRDGPGDHRGQQQPTERRPRAIPAAHHHFVSRWSSPRQGVVDRAR